MADRRFPPPWSIDEQTESYIVKGFNSAIYLPFLDDRFRVQEL